MRADSDVSIHPESRSGGHVGTSSAAGDGRAYAPVHESAWRTQGPSQSARLDYSRHIAAAENSGIHSTDISFESVGAVRYRGFEADGALEIPE